MPAEQLAFDGLIATACPEEIIEKNDKIPQGHLNVSLTPEDWEAFGIGKPVDMK